MKTRALFLAIASLIALVSGCSTVNPGKQYGGVRLESLKTAYIVRHAKSSRDIDTYIQDALAERGVKASRGPMEAKPKDVDFYVEYVDHWKWDLSMYLWSLDIRFADNATGGLIASGSFKQGLLHSFPDPQKKVAEVIEQIYHPK
jgi:hypothetical protein